MQESSVIIESFLDECGPFELTFAVLELAYQLVEYNKKKQGGSFISTLNFYLNIITDSSGSLIPYQYLLPYMNQQKRRQLLWDLQITNMLLSAQILYDKSHQKIEDCNTYEIYSIHCAELIRILGAQVNENLAAQQNYDEKGVVNHSENVTLLKSKVVIGGLNAINDMRLYWVWGGGFVKLLLDESLAPNFFNYDSRPTAHFLDPFTGGMSWSLYFLRLSIHSSLFFKHLLKPSNDEKDMHWKERTNWRRRKYPILNDLFWGPANCLNFFGFDKKMLGTGTYFSQVNAGDVLTAILLVFDVTMAIIEYTEEKTLYEEKIKALDQKIVRLTDKLSLNLNEAQKNIYIFRLHNLQKEKFQYEKCWHINCCSLVINVMYTLALMLAFGMVAFAGPVSALVLAGTILCFAFTVINDLAKIGMDIYKIQLSKEETISLCQEKMILFKDPKIDEEKKCFLFIEIKALKAEIKYQESLIVAKMMHFGRLFLFESFIVPIMILLPFGIGVYPLILGLMSASFAMINACFSVKKEKEIPFNANDYQQFCQENNSPIFFSPATVDTKPKPQELFQKYVSC